MNDIEVGQVLALKIRFNNNGDISTASHPYLVVAVNEDLGIIEVAQIDSLKGKEWKAFKRYNKVVYRENPTETVIDRDSYIQLDNTFKIENFSGLERYRRQTDKLSAGKLGKVLKAYYAYHEMNEIEETKVVYMSKGEILALNT